MKNFRLHKVFFFYFLIFNLVFTSALLSLDEADGEYIPSSRNDELIQRLRENDPGLKRKRTTKSRWEEEPLPYPRDYSTPVAYVNGETLPYTTVFENFQNFRKENPEVMKQIPDDEWYRFRNRHIYNYIMGWVEKQLLITHAKNIGVAVTSSEIDERIRELSNGIFPGKNLSDLLEKQSRSETGFRSEIEETLFIQHLLRREINEIYTENNFLEYFEENKNTLLQPESVFVVTLFKSVFDEDQIRRTEDEIAGIKKQVLELKGNAVSTEQFIRLAKENSDAPYAGEDSILGWISRDSYLSVKSRLDEGLNEDVTRKISRRIEDIEKLKEFYFDLPLNEVSEVYRSQVGFHLAIVLARQDAKEDYASVKDEIELSFMEEYRSEFVKEIREDAIVIVKFEGISDDLLAKANAAFAKK